MEGDIVGKSYGAKRISLWWIFAFALALSTAMLYFCSKSSPAYPLNDWPDANVFLSAGKAMLEGKLIYRDLYDHKGPLLFVLHALCAWISFDGFFGVWLMEILFWAVFLVGVYQLVSLYGGHKLALAALPLLSVMLLTSISFQMGDSAEELALPMMIWPLYQLLRSLREKDGQTTRIQLMIAGFLLGCVFWLKFTVVGFSAGICLMLSWLGWKKNGWNGAAGHIGWMLLGFLFSSLPWFIWFAAVDGLGAFLKVYLYDNLFLYAGDKNATGILSHCKGIVISVLSWLRDNPGYTVPMLIGLVWLVMTRKISIPEKLSWLLCTALGGVTIFFGGRYYLYYGFAFGVIVPVLFTTFGAWLKDRKSATPEAKPHRAVNAAIALVVAVCIALCPVLSPNMPDFHREPTELMQIRFGNYIKQYDDPTLLNFEFLDWGFYTAAGVAPHLKYYHLANMPLEELHSEQQRYVREGLSDFVVTRRPLSEELSQMYVLADTCKAPDGLWFTDVYLYKLKTLDGQ